MVDIRKDTRNWICGISGLGWVRKVATSFIFYELSKISTPSYLQMTDYERLATRSKVEGGMNKIPSHLNNKVVSRSTFAENDEKRAHSRR